MKSRGNVLFVLLVVGALVSQEQKPKVIDIVKMQTSHTDNTKDGGAVKVVSLIGSYAVYTIGCNEDEESCKTPDTGQSYALVPSPVEVYKCENVALKILNYNSPPGTPDHYRGFYCLRATYPKF